MIITTSRVTRNSENAATLRTACNTAIQEGRSVEITEEYVHGDWWTTYKIEWPDNREVITTLDYVASTEQIPLR